MKRKDHLRGLGRAFPVTYRQHGSMEKRLRAWRDGWIAGMKKKKRSLGGGRALPVAHLQLGAMDKRNRE